MENFPANGENSFMVVLLGVVFDPEKRQVLIIRRKEDELVPRLKWAFPGGEANSKEKLEDTLIERIKEETGYDVEVLGSVFARILPEKKDMVLVYYLCEIIGGEERAGDGAEETKWVKPEEIRQYFTTSFEPLLEEYITNLR